MANSSAYSGTTKTYDINRSFCVANAPCGHKLKRKRLRSGRIQQQPQQRRPFTATSCRQGAGGGAL
ncbi:hypothetical protein RUM44_000229 [Polyplax serrata]|uniref:Uncharacterized protein n=1 Tax=Polyplax serrata TaxID=468196 RepID=A0ABR1B5K0_POLSC